MKTLLLFIILAITSFGPLAAREMTFIWNPQTDCDGWTVETRVGTEEWKSAGATANPTWQGTFPDGLFDVRVVAWKSLKNAAGGDAGLLYSEPSDTLPIPIAPVKPGGVKVTVVVTVNVNP